MTAKPKKRWYDQNKALSASIPMLETFPIEIQALIADSMIVLAERECRADKLMDELKSLGAEVVLGLYKSKNKRRVYDSNPSMHKAMNYLYILPDANRTFMGEQIRDVIQHVYAYFQTCKAASVEPSLQDVGAITKTFAHGGTVEAQQTVEKFKTQYADKAPDTVREKSGGEGMQVRDKK